MISSVALNGTLGFAMVIALLFCLGDPERILTTATGYPYIEMYLQATNSKAAASAMVSPNYIA